MRDPDGRILLVRRAAGGGWAIPGGHLEFGESFAGCARREFREEIGSDVELTGLLGIYSDPSTQIDRPQEGGAVHIVGVVFEGRIVGRFSRGTDDVAEVGWFDPDRLPSPIWKPNPPVIKDAISSSTRPFIR